MCVSISRVLGLLMLLPLRSLCALIDVSLIQGSHKDDPGSRFIISHFQNEGLATVVAPLTEASGEMCYLPPFPPFLSLNILGIQYAINWQNVQF